MEKNNKYEVIWRVDIEADCPERAAEMARAMQIRPGTTATVFEVTPEGGSLAETVEVDLQLIETAIDDAKEIQRIIREHGEFSTMDVEADCSPSIGFLGSVCQLADSFQEDGVMTTIYDGDVELAEEFMSYGQVASKNLDAIQDILKLAQDWEADNLKTEKRIAD